MLTALLVTVVAQAGYVPPRYELRGEPFRRDTMLTRGGASSAAPQVLLSLSLLPPDSECSGTAPDGVTFTRASGATCIASTTGFAYALSSNRARVTSKGLLVESPATNEALYSRNVAHAVWSDGGIAATCTADDALGMDVSTLVAVCTSGTVAQFSTSATGPRTFSAYVKTGPLCFSGTATLEADAASTTVAIDSVWKRIVLPYTSDGDVLLAITGSCQFVVDYVQDEAGGVATSPIVTAGTAVSRAGDVSTAPLPPGFNPAEGCGSISFTPLWTGGFPNAGDSRIWGLGHNNNRLGYTATSYSAYAGTGNGLPAVAPSHVAGSTKRFTTEWSLSAGQYSVTNETTGTTGNIGVFVGFLDAPSIVNVGGPGGYAWGHLSNLVLGNGPGACQ